MVKSDPRALLDKQLSSLDVEETRYVYTRAMTTTDKDAYKAVGVSYNWLTAHDKEKLNSIAAELAKDVVYQMLKLMEQHGVRATKELIDELDNRDVRVRSAAALKLIEYIIGKPTVYVEQDVKQSNEITVTIKRSYD